MFQLTADHEACVVEMGMRGLGQIAELVDIGEPTIGVVYQCRQEHIELLGSQENIAKAKSELVQGLDANGTAILNGDDPFVAPMQDLCPRPGPSSTERENRLISGREHRL